MAIPNKNIGAFQEMLFSITLLAFYTRPVVFTYGSKIEEFDDVNLLRKVAKSPFMCFFTKKLFFQIKAKLM